MKIAALIARILLGLVFVVFGANGFLNFLPMPKMPPSTATTFLTILVTTHYALIVSGFQLIGGALLLVNKFVPLGLTLLGPVIALLTHLSWSAITSSVNLRSAASLCASLPV